MTARKSGIGNGEEFLRPEVGQRPPKKESTFGKIRKPLQRKSPLKSKPSRRPRMSADAQVQEAMLGKGRCWVADYGRGCTDGLTQRSHIVPQQRIRDEFEYGAYLFGGRWYPIEPDMFPLGDWKVARTLQEILDDNRNFVPTCPNHNVDGIEMVKALGVAGFPPDFDSFKAEYGWHFNGRYWARDREAA